METRIASYQEPGLRLQLIRIEIEDIGTDGIPTSLTRQIFQIRKNRKVVCNYKWESPARTKFVNIIANNLLQTKIDL